MNLTINELDVRSEQVVTIELTNGTNLSFKITRDAYSKFIDESAQQRGKLSAMQSFLMRTATKETQDIVRTLTANPANITTIAGAVIEQYMPDIEIAVK